MKYHENIVIDGTVKLLWKLIYNTLVPTCNNHAETDDTTHGSYWKWRGSKRTEAPDRTVPVVHPSALEAQRWETYNKGAPWRESREVTGCQGAVTIQDQDALQKRKASGLLRSKSHHELLYLWGEKIYASIFQSQLFSNLYMLIIHYCLVLFGNKSLSV